MLLAEHARTRAKRATVQDAAAIARLDGFAPRAAGVCH